MSSLRGGDWYIWIFFETWKTFFHREGQHFLGVHHQMMDCRNGLVRTKKTAFCEIFAHVLVENLPAAANHTLRTGFVRSSPDNKSIAMSCLHLASYWAWWPWLWKFEPWKPKMRRKRWDPPTLVCNSSLIMEEPLAAAWIKPQRTSSIVEPCLQFLIKYNKWFVGFICLRV